MDEVNCVFTRFMWSLAWTGDLPAQELHSGSLWIKGKGNLLLTTPLNSLWTNPEPHPELTRDYFNYPYLISFKFLVHLSFLYESSFKSRGLDPFPLYLLSKLSNLLCLLAVCIRCTWHDLCRALAIFSPDSVLQSLAIINLSLSSIRHNNITLEKVNERSVRDP